MRVLSMEYRVSGVGSGPRHDIGGFFGRLAVRSALSRGRGSTACCPRCLEVGLAILGRPLTWPVGCLCSSFWSISRSGPPDLSLVHVPACQRVPSKLCFEEQVSPRGFSTLAEALKRSSVRLGAPTACARHWLSQREICRSEDPPAVEKIRIRIQQTQPRS